MAYPVSAARGRSTAKPRNKLLNDLVAFWRLDEASGNALDCHGGRTLTDYGGVGAGAGKVYATARTFDGATQRLERASSAGLEMGDTDWTVAAWFYATEFSLPSPYENHYIGSGRVWNGGSVLGVNTSRQLFSFWFSGAGGSVDVHYSTSALVLNTWYLAGWKWDSAASVGGLRINAGAWQIVAEGALTHTPNLTAPFVIGATPASTFMWTGSLGPICYWDRVLDENDWLNLWNGGAGLPYASFTE